MTGTPAGVVYNTPDWVYQTTKGVKWLATLSFLDYGPVDYILEQYIEESFEAENYLQLGDNVKLSATYLGTIEVDVVE
ncbi:hypothetical protein [Vibrio mexicanus]|uniref:hypothetical protein n=1 Tax=Vibrio mexicanus TaxID=1004326 RepID=UPI001EE1B008|nr:hypothetical protein [Vibrio mexicanus]